MNYYKALLRPDVDFIFEYDSQSEVKFEDVENELERIIKNEVKTNPVFKKVKLQLIHFELSSRVHEVENKNSKHPDVFYAKGTSL